MELLSSIQLWIPKGRAILQKFPKHRKSCSTEGSVPHEEKALADRPIHLS